MKVKYKREMRHNYLILEATKERLDSFEIRMLAGNAIDGLLRFRVKQEEQCGFFYYEITSRQPLSRMLECREIRRDELRQLIFGIGEALGRMEDYLLQESHVLLEPEYIYIEPETFRVWLCYVPGYSGDFPAAMGRLLHYLLKKADHRDNDTVVLAYRLYQESQKDYFGIEDLLRAVRESGREPRSFAILPDEPEQEAEEEEEIREDTTEKSETGERFRAPSLPENRYGSSEESQAADAAAGSRGRAGLLLLIPAVSLAGLWLFRGKEGLLRYGVWLCVGEAAVMLLALLFLTARSGHRSLIGQRKMESQAAEEEQWRMTFSSADEAADGEGGEQTGGRETGADDPEGRYTEREEQPFLEQGNANEGNTVLLSEMEEGKGGMHLLKSLDPAVADIPVPYFPFFIGKQEGIVDYALQKETVSRLHLRMDEDEEGYCIMDLNSSNGTRVGERMLDANESCRLNSGDKVIIADIAFVFY